MTAMRMDDFAIGHVHHRAFFKHFRKRLRQEKRRRLQESRLPVPGNEQPVRLSQPSENQNDT